MCKTSAAGSEAEKEEIPELHSSCGYSGIHHVLLSGVEIDFGGGFPS